mmetsp:Transcript_59715/g.94557  ORF Transcript_59715/g.94557 Transcript_59715/m.94557 type:complete len:179 (+) Transcript_59715:67-603(+)
MDPKEDQVVLQKQKLPNVLRKEFQDGYHRPEERQMAPSQGARIETTPARSEPRARSLRGLGSRSLRDLRGRGHCEISPVRRRRPNEVAKVVSADGHIRLRGVASMSDVRRYCQDIDPYSRKNWAVREAFKSMRCEEHQRTANLTWSALKNWQASERPLDEWYATVRRMASEPNVSVSS